MLTITLLESKTVKLTKTEIDLLTTLCNGSEVMVNEPKGTFWCEDIDLELVKTTDGTVLVKYLSDSGLGVTYTDTHSTTEETINHCHIEFNFFRKSDRKTLDKQLNSVHNTFNVKKKHPFSFTVVDTNAEK